MNGVAVSCEQNHKPGTQVQVHCKTGYTINELPVTPNHFTCLNDGKWNHPTYRCYAVCGLQTPVGTQYISYGHKAGVSEAPWNVAVYRNNELICGATIISERIVLSAAHCFCKYNFLQSYVNLNN